MGFPGTGKAISNYHTGTPHLMARLSSWLLTGLVMAAIGVVILILFV